MADVLISSQTTNATGQVDFSGLPPGHYYYVMASAPRGYDLDSTPYLFDVVNATPVSQTRQADPTQVGAIQITKNVDSFPNLLLSGGRFSVTRRGITFITQSDPTVDGLVAFSNLMTMTAPSLVAYSLQEVVAPAGYTLNTTNYSVSAIAGETVNQDVPNTPITSGELVVTLDDANYSTLPLEGAQYELHWTTP